MYASEVAPHGGFTRFSREFSHRDRHVSRLMETKQLGQTEVRVPEIGLGAWKYQGGIEPLRRGIELGANLIDTAEIYRTEDVVGRAVKGIREQVFIATKVSGNNLGYDEVLRAAEESLRRLEIDTIDLYQIHWPNKRVPIKETMRAMESLVDSGHIRFIGVSNFSVGDLKEAGRSMANHPIVSNQVLYNLDRREIERSLLPYCQENGITIIAYTPLANGKLAKKPGLLSARGVRVLGEVAKETKKTMAQVALNWCLAHPNVIAIPKSDRVDRTEENCGASGWQLAKDHMQSLNQAFS